ncbi:MAG: hypothetical protein J6U77_03880 [Verrucomicrobia bacterium]|nr:hypothetical protein [Verrucomicrobiota bacterium]
MDRAVKLWVPGPQPAAEIEYSFSGTTLTLTFTGSLQESSDAVNWTPVLGAQGTYEVNTTKGRKFYRSVQ